MSPDWADKPEAVPYSQLDNPQSLNLYGYVNNNPLSKANKDGHDASDILKLTGAAELIAPEATPIILGVAAGARAVGAIHDNWDSISSGFHSVFSKGDAPAAPTAPASSPAAPTGGRTAADELPRDKDGRPVTDGDAAGPHTARNEAGTKWAIHSGSRVRQRWQAGEGYRPHRPR